MSGLLLSRAVLRRDAAVASLAGLLVPVATGARADAAHRLVWALFSDGPDRRRDFLWREEGPGRFLALSARPPNPLHDIFEIDSKPFEPRLAAGDRLGFALRANPVVARKLEGRTRSTHHDVVMNALHPIARGERAEMRLEKVVEAGRAWLARQGMSHGFAPDPSVAVDGYETIRIPRPGAAHLRFGRVDFEGVLTVTDPALFLARIAAGYGRARAFGCGLMLIRRAR